MAQVFPQQHMVTLVDMSSRHLTIKQYNYCFLPKVSYTMAGSIAKSMMSELGYNVTVDVITHKMLTTHCDIFEHIKVFYGLWRGGGGFPLVIFWKQNQKNTSKLFNFLPTNRIYPAAFSRKILERENTVSLTASQSKTFFIIYLHLSPKTLQILWLGFLSTDQPFFEHL